MRIRYIHQIFLNGFIGTRRVSDDDQETAANDVVEPLLHLGGRRACAGNPR